MRCPKCHVDLQTQTDRGIEVQACPSCRGMWFTPAELNQLEDQTFVAPDAEKGSLFIVSWQTPLRCPVCSTALKRFNYRFYDLELDCCLEHGFWLEANDDQRILDLMRKESSQLERKFQVEETWTKHFRHISSPSFFTKLKDLFR